MKNYNDVIEICDSILTINPNEARAYWLKGFNFNLCLVFAFAKQTNNQEAISMI